MSTGIHEFQLMLSEHERDELLLLLEQTLTKTRVEEHRTEATDYRDYVREKLSTLESLLDKVRQLA